MEFHNVLKVHKSISICRIPFIKYFLDLTHFIIDNPNM